MTEKKDVRQATELSGFVNFGTDAKGKDWAACINCGTRYYDWDAAKNIAHCAKCRPAT